MTTCGQWQEAASARRDGEDPGVPLEALDAHLDECAECQGFAARTGELDTLVAAAATPVPDRSTDIMAAVGANRQTRRSHVAVSSQRTPRSALALVGVLQLVTSLPHVWSLADGHTGRDLAAFQLALGVGFLVTATRPATASGLVPTAVTLVVVLAIVSVVDIAGGRAAVGAETVHVTEVVGVALLWMLAPRRTTRRPLRPT